MALTRPDPRGSSDPLALYFQREDQALHVGRRITYRVVGTNVAVPATGTVLDVSTFLTFTLAPDEILLLESAIGQALAADASGMLTVQSGVMYGFSLGAFIPTRNNGRPFPCTLAKVSGDAAYVMLDPANQQAWSYRDIFGMQPLGAKSVNIYCRWCITNNDAGAPHSFTPITACTYRVITGAQ